MASGQRQMVRVFLPEELCAGKTHPMTLRADPETAAILNRNGWDGLRVRVSSEDVRIDPFVIDMMFNGNDVANGEASIVIDHTEQPSLVFAVEILPLGVEWQTFKVELKNVAPA